MARQRVWAASASATTAAGVHNLPQRPPASSLTTPKLSLKVGDLCLELLPSNTNGTVEFQQAMDASSHTLSLVNFTGTLRVVPQGSVEPPKQDMMGLSLPHALGDVVNGQGQGLEHFHKDDNNNTKKRSWQEDQESEEEEEEPVVDENASFFSHLFQSPDQAPYNRQEEEDDEAPRDAQDKRHNENNDDQQENKRLRPSSCCFAVEDVEASNSRSADSLTQPTQTQTPAALLGQPDLSQTMSSSSNSSQHDDPEVTDTLMEEKVETMVAAPARVSLGGEGGRGQEQHSPSLSTLSTTAVSPLKESPLKVAVGGAEESASVGRPGPRWAHSLTHIGNNRWLLYGGQTLEKSSDGALSVKTLNDMYIYVQDKDQKDGNWIQPINYKSALPRMWHTSNFLPDQNLLLVFGGEAGANSKTKADSQVMLLDIDIMLWYPADVTGTVPSLRSGHSSTLLGSFLVVFGGVARKHLNTVFVCDTKKWIWFSPKCVGTAPKPRSYHSATPVGSNRIVVFGGNGSASSFNSVHVLTLTQQTETATTEAETQPEPNNTKKGKKTKKMVPVKTTVPLQYQNHVFTWSHPEVTGEKPAPRTGHTAQLLPDGETICIFGGWDPAGEEESGEEKNYSDVFFLDTNEWKWTKGPIVPRGRVGHCALGVHNNHLCVFGGRTSQDQFLDDFAHISITK